MRMFDCLTLAGTIMTKKESFIGLLQTKRWQSVRIHLLAGCDFAADPDGAGQIENLQENDAEKYRMWRGC